MLYFNINNDIIIMIYFIPLSFTIFVMVNGI